MDIRGAIILPLFAAFSLVASAQQPPAKAVACDYRVMYLELNPSIARIYADSSTGSGFLVSEQGLIATNYHVVRNSRYLAAQFANGQKHAVDAVVLDPRNDVAILKVNPAVVRGIAPLRLLPEAEENTVRRP